MFWSKKKDVQEMKDAVAGPAPIPYQQPETYVAPTKMAPLFVKVDRYKEILETIAKIKGTLKNLDSVLKTRQSIDKLREDADSLLIRQLGVCAQCTHELDDAFAKPAALEQMVVAAPEAIEGDMQQITTRLSQLSDQLQQIR